MRRQSQTSRAWMLAASLSGLAAVASAQSLITTQGVVVATDGDPVPDANGIPIPGFTFAGSSALGDTPVLDSTGHIFFRGRFQDSGGSLTTFNDRAYFYGSSRADLKLIVRGGDQAPGLPAGVLLRTTTGSSSALSSSVRVSADGRLFWGSSLYDGGVTITDSNSEGIFGGPVGAQTILVQKGDIAPSTGGATFAQAFGSPGQQFTGINRNGMIYFQGALVSFTGAPPVTTTSGINNQVGIWAGMPGALELVARKSDPVSGLGGAVAIDTFATIGSVMQMNNAGHLLYEIVLSTTQGSPAATPSNDRAYMMFTPGSGSVPIVREGDAAPGTFNPSTSSFATFNALSGDLWSAGVSGNCWTRNDEMIFQTELLGGNVVPGVSDRALYRGGPSGLALIQRRGDAAPGTDATFAAWNNNSLLLNSAGQVCFQAILEGGTSSTANDTGVWAGTPGSMTLVMREGDTVSGTGGSIAGNLSGSSIYFNDQGQVLFNVNLTGGTITGTALFAWDAVNGLTPVILPGASIQVSPSVSMTESSFSGVQFNNADGAALHFGHDGTIGIRVGLVGGTNAQMIVRLPSIASGTPYCFGDGSGTACPCGNAGAAGNGCASSVNANGGNLAGTGLASLTNESLHLVGTGVVSTSGLYFQGTTQQSGGAGAVFGDGLRCAVGSVVRLGTKVAVGGTSTYPGAGDASISLKGGITTPGTREYQLWYRNAGPFCTPSTFNLTNGLEVTWVN